MRKAVFPGSFDPFTFGHLDILNRAQDLFDKIHISIGHNSTKKYLNSLAKRIEMLDELFAENDAIVVDSYEGLTVNHCQSIEADFIIRGLRNSLDFEYEKTIAALNKSLSNNIETIFLISDSEYSHISSTIVREIIKHGGPIDHFIPNELIPHLKNN
ncbi:UNVERIFIED_CONTAM: hypothetical protein GTU68_033684 [Idotea baltica]|nr:hypothetical protein [Idotea baltica]